MPGTRPSIFAKSILTVSIILISPGFHPHARKKPARGVRVSGPFEILSKRLLLRYTGHSRQHAFRVMMVMPVMEVQQAHLYFRVAFKHREVNSSCTPAENFTQ